MIKVSTSTLYTCIYSATTDQQVHSVHEKILDKPLKFGEALEQGWVVIQGTFHRDNRHLRCLPTELSVCTAPPAPGRHLLIQRQRMHLGGTTRVGGAGIRIGGAKWCHLVLCK